MKGTIIGISDLFSTFERGFRDTAVKAIQDNGELAKEYIREQLYAGVNGDEQPLRPTYTADPWFDSYEAGIWQGRGEDYMKWKLKIQPPGKTRTGVYPARDGNTPNLIITGEFYGSLTATPMSEGIIIGSDNPMGADIERKYGSIIFKPGEKVLEHFVLFKLMPRLVLFYQKYGMMKV